MLEVDLEIKQSVTTVHNKEIACLYVLPGTSDSSSEDKSAIETCLQRPILKSNDNDLPEKLGELIALSYILLVCKIFRRIHKQRPMKEVTVNGLLLDKILGVAHCEVIGNVSGPQDAQKSLQVNVYDASGQQLTAATLCYHLKLLNTSYSNI